MIAPTPTYPTGPSRLLNTFLLPLVALALHPGDPGLAMRPKFRHRHLRRLTLLTSLLWPLFAIAVLVHLAPLLASSVLVSEVVLYDPFAVYSIC